MTRTLPPILARYLRWTLLMLAASAVYTIALTLLLQPRHPYGLNLIWGTDRWWDFLIFKVRFLHFRQPTFWSVITFPFVYPAPLAVAFGLLYKLAHPLRDYLAACAVALLAWIVWFTRSLRGHGLAALTALAFAGTIGLSAWPVWFFFTTANIEGLLVVTLGLGVIAVLRGRLWLGAALIGIAGAMKFYPLILLGLLLSRRRYWQFAFGVVTAVLVTVASLAYVGPTLSAAAHIIPLGIDFMRDTYIFSLLPNDLYFNHSLFLPVKTLIAHLHHAIAADSPAQTHALLEKPYEIYVATAAAFGLATFFLRIRSLPMLNQVIALTVCAVLLPPISLDYTLLHLLIPFAFLCLYTLRSTQPGDPEPVLLFACFAIIFTVGTFFTIRLRMAAPARILALLLLLYGTIRRPLPWPELDEAPIR